MPQDPNYQDNYAGIPEKELETSERLSNETADYLKHIDPNKKNSGVPPPPKPGELIYCQMCRKAMLPEHFSKDEAQRKWEFKWQVHWACKLAADDYLDRMTPGLLSERRRQQKLQENAEKNQRYR